MCDHTGDLAYITDDTVAMAVGWNGMYIITDSGKNIEKSDVFYCKCIGYGAPEKDGGVNTLYIYGKPAENDPEGIYRSTDGGKTWVCINTDHLYGGTGNGNFLVGDMNEFGTVFMSTVGAGIVCGKLSGSVPPTTDPTEPSDTTKPTKPTTSDTLYGDANCDGKVEIADATLILQFLTNKDEYQLTDQGMKNADVIGNGDGVTAQDALVIQQVDAGIYKVSDLPIKD